MTKPGRRKVITIETHQQTLIRSRKKAFVAWCQRCRGQAWMLPPEHAAILGGATERLIFRQIENGDLHFIEIKEGVLFICRNSLERIQKDSNLRREGGP